MILELKMSQWLGYNTIHDIRYNSKVVAVMKEEQVEFKNGHPSSILFTAGAIIKPGWIK